MLYWLDPENSQQPFPNPEQALDEPNGLLAVGGDLSYQRLINAYRSGIFPWYSADASILWWSPDPRTVLFTDHLKISRSLRKTLRQGHFKITFDQCFESVIRHCAEPHGDRQETWITEEMIDAYRQLHQQGYACSVETWHENQLVGGLYGVAIGRMFFGESMFNRANDASKVALVALCRQLQHRRFPLIDCQMSTPHLTHMGAEDIPRKDFLAALKTLCRQPQHRDWKSGKFDF